MSPSAQRANPVLKEVIDDVYTSQALVAQLPNSANLVLLFRGQMQHIAPIVGLLECITPEGQSAALRYLCIEPQTSPHKL